MTLNRDLYEPVQACTECGKDIGPDDEIGLYGEAILCAQCHAAWAKTIQDAGKPAYDRTLEHP